MFTGCCSEGVGESCHLRRFLDENSITSVDPPPSGPQTFLCIYCRKGRRVFKISGEVFGPIAAELEPDSLGLACPLSHLSFHRPVVPHMAGLG